jgi:hypothetical protein
MLGGLPTTTRGRPTVKALVRGRETVLGTLTLYEVLPARAEGFGYLRDVQGQVLTAWHQRRGERDLVVKVVLDRAQATESMVPPHDSEATPPAVAGANSSTFIK